jgi:hypothetical protein
LLVIRNNKHFLFNSVSINKDTIWLTQKQIAEVFDVNVPAISKHRKNIYKDNELE